MEIIQLQFGSYANKVGSKYWSINKQSPNVLIFDVACNGTINTDEELNLNWEGKSQIIKKQQKQSNSTHIYDNNSFVPLSANQFLEYGVFGMETFTSGKTVAKSNCFLDVSFDDKFRLLVEKLDCLSGLQVMTDVDDAFGGLCAGFLEVVRDEYQKVPIVSYGFENRQNSSDNRAELKHSLNVNLAVREITENSSTYVPVVADMLRVKQDNGWSKYLLRDFTSSDDTSTFISSILDTITTPLWSNQIDMHSLLQQLNSNGQTKMVHISSALPLPIFGQDSKKHFIQSTSDTNEITSPFKSLTPINNEVGIIAQFNVTRGIPRSVMGNVDSFSHSLSENFHCADIFVFEADRFRLTPLFDDFFNTEIENPELLNVLQTHSVVNQPDVPSITTMSRFVNTKDSFRLINEMVEPLKKMNISSLLWEFTEGPCALGQDEFLDMVEGNMSLADYYRDD